MEGEDCEGLRGERKKKKKEKEEMQKVRDQIKSCTIDQCSELTSSSLSGYGRSQVQ